MLTLISEFRKIDWAYILILRDGPLTVEELFQKMDDVEIL